MPNEVTHSIMIKGSAKELYDVWSDFEKHPEFSTNLKSVTRIDDKLMRWVLKSPLGKDIIWTTETTRDEEAHRIAWRTVDGDIKTSGQITFLPMPDDQTQVTLMMTYVPPTGLVGSIALNLIDDPAARAEQDLRSFKKYVENNAV